MKLLQRFILPSLFGLVVYISIRLVNDSMSKTQFPDRPWQQNSIEIIATILGGLIFSRILRYVISTSKVDAASIGLKIVVIEFTQVFISILVIFNPILYGIHFLIKQPVKWNDFIIGNLLVILFVLLHYAILRGYTLIRLYIQKSIEMEHLKNEQLQNELKFLRAQYHPHFLFNALNTVYFQMDESIEEAKKTVENFAELLRYQLYEHQELATLEVEIKYLRNFIQLQKTRASEKLQLSIDIDGSLHSEKIYPLLLLPMLENAFKYVSGTCLLHVSLLKDAGWLEFKVVNSVSEIQPVSTGGIGLDNLKRRLELLYPAGHSFKVENDNLIYTATLKLQLQ